jgi:hypothetical protein
LPKDNTFKEDAMHNFIFLAVLICSLTGLLAWGFGHLPRERWQVFAVIPNKQMDSGSWSGLNLTFYGVFNALAYTFAAAILILLLATGGVPRNQWMALIFLISILCVPAAKIIARFIEGKPNTFTVAGAAFAGMVFAPMIVLGINIATERPDGLSLPLLPVMSALSIAYCFGESIGRLACISFGCCYGRPIASYPVRMQRIFSRFCFVFTGKSKKIAYAHHLDGQAVVPVQAMTCIVLSLTGCVSMVFHLNGNFSTAFLIAVCVEKLWRWISEFFRADFRGVGFITAYQWLSLASIPLAALIVFASPVQGSDRPLDILVGLEALWSPQVLLFLEGIALGIFLYTGRSRVTGSHLHIFVHPDQI